MPTVRSFCAKLVVMLLVAWSAFAWAQQDKTAERNARRQQLQMQNLQQQMQEAQTAKAHAEAEKAEAEKKLATQAQEIPRAQGAARKAAEALKAADAERIALAARVAALERQLAEQKRSSDEAIATKDRGSLQSTTVRDKQQAQLQARLDEQVKWVAECSDKNQRLLSLSAELLDRYRHKGVAEVLKQREPLLGLSDVQMFNLVQEYRDKADAERFTPPTNR